jgi:hypothetical protein
LRRATHVHWNGGDAEKRGIADVLDILHSYCSDSKAGL